MYVDEIEIKNFRSIMSASVKLKNLSIFVGDNDSGKSTILKAANLFFNGKTEHSSFFNFETDYSHYANPGSKQAKEVLVRLKINVPRTYKESGRLIWTKKWRATGFHEETLKLESGQSIGDRSKLPNWVRRIKYNYVPAIKGEQFFSDLLGDLYNVLSRTINKDLNAAASDFIKYLRSQTESISDNILKELNINSLINFPDVLDTLFRTLDFQTSYEDKEISLSHRGDGLKVRHIPSVLKFIAEQENINRAQGGPKITTIWGYEEPENNLEMRNAFNKANELVVYSKEIQILVTTHSPAFYSLSKNGQEGTSVHVVNKETTGSSYCTAGSTEEVDQQMGLLSVITPYVVKVEKEMAKLEIELDSYRNRTFRDMPTIFVEGNSDKILLDEAMNIFFPGKRPSCLISAERKSCSDWVRKCLLSWHVSPVLSSKSIGIFDLDNAGKRAKKTIRRTKGNDW